MSEHLCSGRGSHLPTELHPLSQRYRKEAQIIKWQRYEETTSLQIPKFELLFRLCVNI